MCRQRAALGWGFGSPVGGVSLGFAHGALVFPLAPHTRFPFIFRLADWDVLPLLEEVPELRRRSALRGVSVDGANLTATAPHRPGRIVARASRAHSGCRRRCAALTNDVALTSVFGLLSRLQYFSWRSKLDTRGGSGTRNLTADDETKTSANFYLYTSVLNYTH